MTVRTAQKGNADRVLRYVAGGWILESGLLLGPQAYLSGEDDAYFSGGGTTFLPEGTAHHIQGKYPNGQLNWAIATPEHDVQSVVYTTVGYPSALPGYVPNPSMYTGLMRLAYQAKLARGLETLSTTDSRRLRGLFPWDQDIAELFKYYGLMRAPDYTYFSIKVTSTGCAACRMQTDPEVEDLRQRLIASSFSDRDAERAEAALLSTLTPVEIDDGQGGTILDEYILVDSAEIGLTTFGFLIGYWWHFSYPQSALSECSMITHSTIGFQVGECPSAPSGTAVRYHAQHHKIEFTFSRATVDDPYSIAGELTTVQIGTDWWLWPDATVVWRPSYDHTRIQSFYGETPCTSDYGSAPIYCWYDKTGYRSVWLNVRTVPAETDVHTPPLADRRNCGVVMYAVPTYSRINVPSRAAMEFSLDDGISEAELVSRDTSADEYVCSASYVPRNGYEDIIYTSKNNVGVPCPDSVFLAERRDIFGEIVDVDTDWDVYFLHKDENIDLGNYIPSYATAVIVPLLNAEAVVILGRQGRKQSTRTDYTSSEVGKTLFGKSLGRYHGGTNPSFPDVFFEGGFSVDGAGPYLGSGTEWILNATRPFDPGTLGNQYQLDTPSVTVEPEQPRIYTADLYSSSGDANLQPDPQDERWNGYFNYLWNNGFDAIHFSAPASCGGNMKYPTNGHTPSEPAIRGGYVAEDEILAGISFESSPVHWIGWA